MTKRAMSGAERQRKWMEKNRALHNLRRRNARKKGGDATCRSDPDPIKTQTKNQSTSLTVSDAAPTVQSAGAAFQTKKVGEFRMLVIPEEKVEERSAMPVTKPKVFFNDHGAQISERVWNELQEKKRLAAEVGYEFDPQ